MIRSRVRVLERLRAADDSARVVPFWIALVFLVVAVGLVPWIAWLFTSLPDEATANHWRLAWGGFDITLASALATTAVLIFRCSPLTRTAAAVAGTMLVCDAWFDVLTSRGAVDVAVAAVLAVVAELPLAVFCFWIAQSADRVFGGQSPTTPSAARVLGRPETAMGSARCPCPRSRDRGR